MRFPEVLYSRVHAHQDWPRAWNGSVRGYGQFDKVALYDRRYTPFVIRNSSVANQTVIALIEARLKILSWNVVPCLLENPRNETPHTDVARGGLFIV